LRDLQHQHRSACSTRFLQSDERLRYQGSILNHLRLTSHHHLDRCFPGHLSSGHLLIHRQLDHFRPSHLLANRHLGRLRCRLGRPRLGLTPLRHQPNLNRPDHHLDLHLD
jgi:hypothetical protein